MNYNRTKVSFGGLLWDGSKYIPSGFCCVYVCVFVCVCLQCVLYAPALFPSLFFFTKSHGLTRCCAL